MNRGHCNERVGSIGEISWRYRRW